MVNTCSVARCWKFLTSGLATALGLLLITAPLLADPGPLPQIPRGLELDDPTLPFQPRVPRSAVEQDRVQALALFAEGRMLAQRNDNAAALRKYQRAFRYDSQSVTTLRELIPLAFALNRNAEAVRYAAKFGQLDASDPGLLRRLGVVLTEQGEWKQALALYEKVLAAEPANEKSAANIMLRMELGRLYFLNDEPQPAAKMFEQVLAALDAKEDYQLTDRQLNALRGDKGAGLELIFTVCLDAERWDAAKQALDKLLPLIKNPAVESYLKASLAARRADHSVALQELNRYFEAREVSRNYAPYELLREVLEAAKQTDELIPRLEKQSQEQLGNSVLSFALAEEYRRTGQFVKATRHYQAALDKQVSREVYRGLTESLIATKEYEKLLGLLGQVVAKSGSLEALLETTPASKNSPAEVALLTVPATNRELGELALKLYDGQAREHAAPLRAAGILAIQDKNWGLAEQLFNRAITAKPADKAEILLSWGLKLLIGEQTTAAVNVLQRGVDEKVLPDSNPAFQFYLSGALAFAKRHDEALAAARVALDKQPASPRFMARIPWIHNHAKRYDQARTAYQELIEKFNDQYENEETRQVLREARLALSNIAVLQHDLPTAEEWLEQVLDEFPDDLGAQNDLGYLWADQNKRLERALQMIEAALAAEPENAAYLDSYGWILYRLGRYEAALKAQLQAATPKDQTADTPIDGVVLDHLAEIYLKLGQREQALETWRKSIQALEKSDEQGKIESVRQKLAAAEKQQ